MKIGVAWGKQEVEKFVGEATILSGIPLESNESNGRLYIRCSDSFNYFEDAFVHFLKVAEHLPGVGANGDLSIVIWPEASEIPVSLAGFTVMLEHKMRRLQASLDHLEQARYVGVDDTHPFTSDEMRGDHQ